MHQIIRDYYAFEKYMPSYFKYDEYIQAPYKFIAVPRDINNLCVLTHMGNIVYHTPNYNLGGTIERLQDRIFELVCDDDLLVSFENERILPIYNYSTKEILVNTFSNPIIKNEVYYLAFGEDNKPVKISKVRLEGINVLNKTSQFLYGDLKRENIFLFFTCLFTTDGTSFHRDEETQLAKVILPCKNMELTGKQYGEFVRTTKKKFQKTWDKKENDKNPPFVVTVVKKELPGENRGSEDIKLLPGPKQKDEIYFTDILQRAIKVDHPVELVLDQDLSDYGVKGIKLFPAGNLLIDIVKRQGSKTIEESKKALEEILGHNNFIVQFFDK